MRRGRLMRSRLRLLLRLPRLYIPLLLRRRMPRLVRLPQLLPRRLPRMLRQRPRMRYKSRLLSRRQMIPVRELARLSQRGCLSW